MMQSAPPKISSLPSVIDPVRPHRIEPDPTSRHGPPVHPMAAMLLLLVDNLWNLADWAVITWIVTVPLSFLTVFFPTLLIQRALKRDRWGRSLALALALGIVAAVPTSVTGTPVGVALLAWFGIDRLIGREGRPPAVR